MYVRVWGGVGLKRVSSTFFEVRNKSLYNDCYVRKRNVIVGSSLRNDITLNVVAQI